MKLTGTNRPRDLIINIIPRWLLQVLIKSLKPPLLNAYPHLCAGAHGRGETPVSIPNTEVKTPSAYGTAGFPGGRVGQCRHSIVGVNIMQARSSVGEHYLDTVGVGGSIPPAPTKLSLKQREKT